jgi:hypothetical protein
MQSSNMEGGGSHLRSILVGDAAALLLQQRIDHAAIVVGGCGKKYTL